MRSFGFQTIVGLAAGCSLLLMAAGAPPSFAQSAEEAELAQRVQTAQTTVQSLQAELSQAHAAGDPILQQYASLLAQRDRLTGEINTLMDRVDEADNRVQRLPITLTARRDALYDIITRMYRENGDADLIRQREADLADVERQIARLEAANEPARAAQTSTRRDVDRARNSRRAVERQVSDIELSATEARTRIEALERRLAEAQAELHRASEYARLRLNDSAPPYLASVEARSGRRVAYQAEWQSASQEAEELLRLAQYLHDDLGRSIDLRQQRVDEWIEQVTADQRTYDEAMRAYVSLLGGSHDGVLGYIERGLDAVSGGWAGALITGGSLTWRKIGVELGDAALTVFRDTRSGAPVYAALAIEAVSQVSDVFWRDGPRNPSWDVTNNPTAAGMVQSSRANISGEQERALYESLTSDRIRTALEGMRGQVREQLQSETYRNDLVSEYGGANLASALTEATFRARRPELNFDDRNLIGRDPAEWAWGFLTTPSGAMKSLIKEAMFGDGTNYSNGRAVFLDVIQSAVRDGLLEQLERERIEAWDRVLQAEIDVTLSVANLRNQGRIRRMDTRIRRVLADEVIPALTHEIENARNARNLVVSRATQVTGRRAQLELRFSAPVVVTMVQLGDQTLEFEGEGESWTAEFNPGDYEEISAILMVDAHHAAVTDRRLDNPETVATWSSLDSRFNHYEADVDRHHAITIEPPSGTGFAIVLDTSGSMVEDGSTRLSQAQAALAEFFNSGRIREGDQVALFTYSECSVSRAVAFTQEHELAANAVAASTAGGATPLAASIDLASSDLASRNVERGVLVVVTDGEDSCEGDVGAALTAARERVDSIRRRTVR